MAKGNSGSRRWITRKPIDRRPIISVYDVPRWQRELETFAPWGCGIFSTLAIALAAYAWATDLLAGHLR